MKKFALIVAAFAGLLAAVPAQAAFIFDIAGRFTGSISNPTTTPSVLNFTNSPIEFQGLVSGGPTAVVRGGIPFLKFALDDFGAVTNLGAIDLGQNFNLFVGRDDPVIAIANGNGILLAANLKFGGPTGLYFTSLLDSSPVRIGRTTISLTSGRGVVLGAFLPDAAVPEASTWAMFILGFGVAGLALRRRARPAFAG
jgi:hypothetical protein